MKQLAILSLLLLASFKTVEEPIVVDELKPFENLLGSWRLEGTTINRKKHIQEYTFKTGLNGEIIIFEATIQPDTNNPRKLELFEHGTIAYDDDQDFIRFSKVDTDGELSSGSCYEEEKNFLFTYRYISLNIEETYTYISKDKYAYKTVWTHQDGIDTINQGIMIRIN